MGPFYNPHYPASPHYHNIRGKIKNVLLYFCVQLSTELYTETGSTHPYTHPACLASLEKKASWISISFSSAVNDLSEVTPVHQFDLNHRSSNMCEWILFYFFRLWLWFRFSSFQMTTLHMRNGDKRKWFSEWWTWLPKWNPATSVWQGDIIRKNADNLNQDLPPTFIWTWLKDSHHFER